MNPKEIFELQAQFFRVMGNSTRLELIKALRQSPQSIAMLAQATGLGQVALSRHLSVLHHQGIVTFQRRGPEYFYSLANPKIGMIYELANQVLIEQLTHQAEIAKSLEKKSG